MLRAAGGVVAYPQAMRAPKEHPGIGLLQPAGIFPWMHGVLPSPARRTFPHRMPGTRA